MRESFEGVDAQMDDPEFRHSYAASFMNSCIAAQIKIIREKRRWTQAQLAERIGTKQAGISRLENVNYDAWKVETLARLARAFDVRLRISFEEFDSLFDEIHNYGREALERESFEEAKSKKSGESEVRHSAKLVEALAHPDPQGRFLPKGVKDESDISTTRAGIQLFAVRRADSWNTSISSESRGLSGCEMSVFEESRLAQRA
jgi:transcriptional regulator with XRE-family HTH domain